MYPAKPFVGNSKGYYNKYMPKAYINKLNSCNSLFSYTNR